MSTSPVDAVDNYLEDGLRDFWYALCPSTFIKERPVQLKRLGLSLVLWRDADGSVHALEDRCPHRGAPLSQGMIMGDRIACPYHGVEVRHDGVVARVPGSPGCKLEGRKATRSFAVFERAGAVFLYNPLTAGAEPPECRLPVELSDDEQYSSFLCYVEWKCDYRYALDNVMDPMHGIFLHKQSHSMSEGDVTAKFGIRPTDDGFIFEKEGQRNINFDWTEFGETGIQWLRLEIPYPKTGGPGGNFIIVGMCTPISPSLTAVFFWRVRKLPPGWQRDTWRFLYRNRLESRHWHVLEQDRVILERMPADARYIENLYQHDLGIVRLRRHLRNLAQEQLARQATATA